MAAVCLVFAATSAVNEVAMVHTDRTVSFDVAGIDTVRIATDEADITLRDTPTASESEASQATPTSGPAPTAIGASTAAVTLHLSGSRSLKSSRLTHNVVGRTLHITLVCDGAALVAGRCDHRLAITLSTRADVEIISVLGDVDATWTDPPHRIDIESGCGDIDLRVPRRPDGYQVTMTGGIQVPHSALIDNPDSAFRIDARSDCGRISLGS